MTSVSVVVDALEPLGARVVAGEAGREVERAVLVEDVSELGGLRPGDAALLGRRASADVAGYRGDLALRRASDAGVALLVAYGDGELAPTARRLAARGGFVLVHLPDACDLTDALLAAHHALHPDARSALARLVAAHAAIEAAEGAGVEAVVEAASRAGVALRRGDPGELAGPTGPVAPGDAVAPIVRRLASDAAARAERRVRRADELLSRTRRQLLAELLAGTAERAAVVAERARALRFPVDGWHRVARLEVTGEHAGDPLRAHELMEDVARIAAQALREAPSFLVTVLDLALVIAYADRHEAPPPPSIALPNVERVLAAVRDALPGVDVHVGVGGVHLGVEGLRASAAEARSALEAARAAGRANAVVAYDATGLRRMLVEWLASDAARRSVQELLAPLDELDPVRARELVRTLAAYLDHRGSLQRAGAALHLHPNAVAYRIRRISERLGCDLADPDQRLALQIACRARLLSTGGAGSLREPPARAASGPER